MHRFFISLIVLFFGTLFTLSSEDTDLWLSRIETAPNDSGKVDLYVDLGKSLLEEQELAIRYIDEGIALAKSLSYRTGEGDLYNLKGVVFWQSGNLKKAIEFYEMALTLRTPGVDDSSIASGNGNIGLAYLMLGKFEKGIGFLERCKQLRRELKDEAGVAGVCNNLGLAYYYVGDFEKAISHLLESAEFQSKQGNESELATNYNNIGSICIEAEHLDQGLSYLTQSLELAEKINDMDTVASVHGNLGVIALRTERFRDAIDHYFRVLEIVGDDGQTITHVEAWNGLGDAYRGIDDLEKAAEAYDRSFEIVKDLENGLVMITTLLSLSELNFALGMKATADDRMEYFRLSAEYGEKALNLARENNAANQVESGERQLYLTYQAMGEFDQALEHHVAYKAQSDDMLNKEKHEQIAEMESKYQLVSKNREIDSLQASNQIQELRIQEQEQRVKAQRRLIFGGVAVSTLALLLVIVLWQLNQIKQRNVKNELIIQNLQTEQKVLRAQMNPHFIYNSLNSIQAFISSNESYYAEKYLSKFAALMRGILENSLYEFVPFEKELAVISHYMELEALRFKNRFRFVIEIDDDFEEDFVEIPPMLIQPFLENAILHGLKGVDDGVLKLRFEENEKEGMVVCTIDDNGIGRKRSGEMNRQQNLKKKSLATEITQRRLEVIARQTGKVGSLEIIDKAGDSGEASGTRVILKIPLSEQA